MKGVVKLFLSFIMYIGFVQTIAFGQGKEWKSDVIYSEGKVPFHELQDALLTIEGKQITTQEDWLNIRRHQIMGMFSSIIYGRVPEPIMQHRTMSFIAIR